MFKTCWYILSGALISAFFSSCSNNEREIPQYEGADIAFRVNEGQTRGFIDNEKLNTYGTVLSISGFCNGKVMHEGTSMALSNKDLVYDRIEGVERWIIKNGNTPVKYYWNKDGGHYKFFGWLKHDAASALHIPSEWTYDEASKMLTVPEWTLDKNYNQLDFIYSDVHVRDMDEQNVDELGRVPVPFAMHHLFSSFGVGIRNMSDEDITITKVAIEAIHEKGSARIDYNGDFVGVTYGATSTERATGEYFIEYDGEGYVLPKETGVMGNAFAPTAGRVYYMVWPQAKDVVAPTTPVTGEGEREYAASDSILIIGYEQAGKEYIKRVKLPEVAWEAGKRNYFEVQVADRLVELRATVLPWDYTSSEVDFSDVSVLVKESGRLKWDEEKCLVDKAAKKVYVNQGKPVELTFAIDAPVGGQWRVSMDGDITAFKIIDDTPPMEDAMGPIDGNKHRIRIVPQITNAERAYSISLKFAVLTADGKVIPVDNLVQDEDGDGDADIYTIELQRTK